MPWYRIYAVRFDRFGEDRKEIDRILITGSGSFAEIKRDFLRFLYDAKFPREEQESVRKTLNRIRVRDFMEFGAYTEDLHQQLGPGGYLLVKEDEES